jgi:DNA-binding SARP family transcriptional activator
MPDHGVEVAVLGPVTIRGLAVPFRREAARELTVYLAFHRHAVPLSEWSFALWPDRSVATPTLHSTSSDCRRALGRAGPETPRLGRGPSLQLHASVTTDVDRFVALTAAGDPCGIQRAMRLIRGPLFSGLRRTDWAVFDGTESRVGSLVLEAAAAGAEASIARRRGEEAEWIVRQALRLCPYEERLYRLLLRALDTQGNRVGLHAAMGQLRRLAGGGGVSFHPVTTDLYRDLLLGAAATKGHPARL